MQDYAIRTTGWDGQVRAFAASTRRLVQTLHEHHQTWPIASAALGRTATISAMMGMMLKHDTDKLTVQINSTGPLGQIVTTANRLGEIRGYVQNPHVHMSHNAAGKLNVGGAVGSGTLNIVQDLGLKEPYRGSVELISGEIAEDFAYYFTVSEQIPSAVAAGVLVEPDNSIAASGGFIVQMMPGASDEVVQKIEESVHQLASVTDLLSQGATPEDLIARIFDTKLVRTPEKLPLTFRCECSRERIETMLKSLGDDEIRSLIQDQGEARIQCHFCNEMYILSKGELEHLLGH